MALRRKLFQMLHDICVLDQLSARDIARICNTSRARGYAVFARRIELFNAETLVDMLWRVGVDLDIEVTGRSPYLRYVFARPRPGWKPPPRARF